MSVALLDVNVLIALLDPAHPGHEDAHSWFAANRRRGWATCPLTLNGCVRVISNPAYPTVEATPADVVEHLAQFCAAREHQFWAASLAITDPGIFAAHWIAAHAKITDAYLLALAVRHKGRLATFDRSIPVRAVHGAGPEDIELIGARP
ncbi:MAG TPA: TA system VapC family ribonuclease toxin [Bryobacteraceae bacterium]|nr:TA system VapC family ribonuclease toxin [Bryobacteraceae bacterium]